MSDLSSLDEIEVTRGSAALRSLTIPPDGYRRSTGISATSSTVSSAYSPPQEGRAHRRSVVPGGRTLLGAAARGYTRAHGIYGRVGRTYGTPRGTPRVGGKRNHLRSASEGTETKTTQQRRWREQQQQHDNRRHRSIVSGNTVLDGQGHNRMLVAERTVPAIEATLRQRSFARHDSSRVQRAWCQISRMVGMDDITFQADDNAVDDAFATTTLVERAIELENKTHNDQLENAEMEDRRVKSNAKAAQLLGIAMVDNDNSSSIELDGATRAPGKGSDNNISSSSSSSSSSNNNNNNNNNKNRKNKPSSRCKFHHIKCLLLFLLLKKVISVTVALISLTLWIMAHVNGTLPMLSMYMPSSVLYIILGLFFILLLLVTYFVRRKGTSPMKSIAVFFIMTSPLLLPDPLSSIVLFCIVLAYCFVRKDIRARTLATMVADFVMLIVNVYSMSYSFAVWGDVMIHADNRTATPIGGFWGATTELELESAHVVLRAICSSISLAIVLADLIRIKIGLSSGRMVNGGVSEVRRWITCECVF
jgi:hypothetical protein